MSNKEVFKVVSIKCMAKNCTTIIEIQVKKTWYNDNQGNRVYGYGREPGLSFCNIHNNDFNKAIEEMKALNPNFKIILQKESYKEAEKLIESKKGKNHD